MRLKRLVPVLLAMAVLTTGCNNTEATNSASSTLSIETLPISVSTTVTVSEPEPEPEPESEPEPLTVPEFLKTDVSLLMVGDMLCHKGVYNSGYYDDGTVNFDHLFAHTKDDIAAADLAIVNQETMLGGIELGLSGYPRFNSPFEIGDSLVAAGFDVVLNATNHTIDKGAKAVDNALNFWKEKHPEIAVLGIHGADFTDYSTQDIYVYEQGGIKIAILNYTYGTNGISSPSDRPLIVNRLEEEKFLTDIKKAKELANFVVVCPHWGTEYVYKPTSFQKKWTKLFYENGVDLVIGAHPHVVETVDWYSEKEDDRRMLVYYSLGNYVSTQDKKPRMLGGMAKVNITMDLAANIPAEITENYGGEHVTAAFPDAWKGQAFVKKEGLDETTRGTEEDYYVIDGALTEAGADIAGLPVGTREGDELIVYISDASIDPIVCHKVSGVGKITVYKLSDYTDELAKKNTINSQDSGFTLSYLYDLAEEILGDWYTHPAEVKSGN